MEVRKTFGNITCVATGTLTEIFKQLSLFDETFEDTNCGVCGNNDISYVHRTVEGNDFFELKCRSPKCRAKLQFGIGKDGGLYPKRLLTDKKGKAIKDEETGRSIYLPNSGWGIYRGQAE